MLLVREYFKENTSRLKIIKKTLEKVCTEYNPSFNGENFEVSEIAKRNGYDTDFEYYFEHYKQCLNIKTQMPSIRTIELFLAYMLDEIKRGCTSCCLDYIVTNDDIIVACYIKW